jgi:hypothetical protein
MKKLILVFTILLSFGIANAQWYSTYGVTNINELTKEQCDLALEKANSTITLGKVFTFGGAALTMIGIIVSFRSATEYLFSFEYLQDEPNKRPSGDVLICGGAVACCIGIPFWISGKSQKSQIEIALVKFEDTSYVPSFGLKIAF